MSLPELDQSGAPRIDLIAPPQPAAAEWPLAAHPATTALVPKRETLVATAREWGYFGGDAIKRRRDLWQGRRMLDIGMGGGPHSIFYVESGASSYVGVDPLIATDQVRDFRNLTDPSLPAYHAFPYRPADIMRVYPNVHLYPGRIENVADRLRAHPVDIAIMSAVTEHLEQPEEVVRSIWEILRRGGYLWLSHGNYYCWTGHHLQPRDIAGWDRGNPQHNANVDWQHLMPSHPAYADPGLNRIRLADLRVLIAKYFEILEYKVAINSLPRLTPEIRERWKRYSLQELLGQMIYMTGRRRDEPLDIDLRDRQFFHPSEDYRADRDYSCEDIATYALWNFVYFDGGNRLYSHSDNDYAGVRVFARLQPGDRITVTKFTAELQLRVAEVVHSAEGAMHLRLAEPYPDAIRDNYDLWTIEDWPARGPQPA